jgi:hypothetical protein
MPIKIVEAFDIKLNPEWRRCQSMFEERHEFSACSNTESDYIYVFGGTLD